MQNEGRGIGRPDFPGFPCVPYSIQVEFMGALYGFLDEGGISMLESPTGTGKTLSIICSALQWLVDQKERKGLGTGSGVNRDGLESASGACSDDEPVWMRNFSNKDTVEGKKTEKDGVALARNYCGSKGSCRDMCGGKEKRSSALCGRKFESKSTEREDLVRMRKDVEIEGKSMVEDNGDDEFMVEDYESEEEGGAGAGPGSRRSKRKGVGLSESSSSEEGERTDSEEEVSLKIYFCSRTHSQLSQFVRELRKTSFAKEIRVISLGSRKNFCINEEILRSGSSTSINEKCLELQKNKKNDVSKIKNLGKRRVRQTKASSGCPMLVKKKLQREFKDLLLQGPLDIEELVHLGDSLGTCPYYGTRSSVPKANLVVLPYQSLLSKASRESLGLNLKNNVVIIDEAHNLADSLISMYDSKITESQLADVYLHLEKYLERFRNLLRHGNRRYIQMLMVVTQALLRALEDKNKDLPAPCSNTETSSGTQLARCSSVTINDFLFSSNIDNINFVKLLHYMKESNIMHKVSGYGTKMVNVDKGPASNNVVSGEDGSTLSNFRLLADMLFSLTNRDSDGRIIISRTTATSPGQHESSIKYVMLTGEKIFAEIVDQAHAVILAGGTLQPIEETRERLFPWLPIESMRFFSCGHIVPPESILPIVVPRGPSSRSFDFSYGSRSSPVLMEELGLLLCNLVTVIPEGMVVFFSSFDYEAQVFESWKDSGILDRITKKKRVFREPRKSMEVESVLKEYKETIERSHGGESKDSAPQNGAVLLAVVGGKVSEGINFSDGMGRCVVMVGLPYPNPSDIELMERVKYIEGFQDRNSFAFDLPDYNGHNDGDCQDGFAILRSCSRRGKEYYENLCMKAVNQSIGRVIRHRDDYAAILLVDKRYSTDPSRSGLARPSKKLPNWIKDRLVHTTNNYGEVHKLLHQFFKFNQRRRS